MRLLSTKPLHRFGFIGWREWIELPALGIAALKIKVDTGAKTSAIHAENIRVLKKRAKDGRRRIKFEVCPIQRNPHYRVTCRATVVAERVITNSGGQRERRFVIETPVRLGASEWKIEITLASRDQMSFRMLLGRTAVAGRFFINPGASYLSSHPNQNRIKTKRKESQ